MTRLTRARVLAGAFTAILVMVACASSPPQPARARLTIAATADSNPDATGRPSPVVVRVYQLTADTAFTGADFFALYDDEMKVLGAELIGRNEYVLAPAERRTLELDVSADARFVGIVAAYRDIRNAQWRTVVPAPLRRDDVTISVERARVVFAIPD